MDYRVQYILRNVFNGWTLLQYNLYIKVYGYIFEIIIYTKISDNLYES